MAPFPSPVPARRLSLWQGMVHGPRSSSLGPTDLGQRQTWPKYDYMWTFSGACPRRAPRRIVCEGGQISIDV